MVIGEQYKIGNLCVCDKISDGKYTYVILQHIRDQNYVIALRLPSRKILIRFHNDCMVTFLGVE